MKRKWMVVAAVLLAAALCAFGAAAHAQVLDDAAIRQMEYERAVALGFVPEACLENPDQVITHREFCETVRRLVERYNPGNMAYWEEVSVKASSSDRLLGRDDAAVGLLYAAIALDCCFETMIDYPEIHLVEQHPGTWAFDASSLLWPELPPDFQVHQAVPGNPAGTDSYHGVNGVMDAAFWFVLLRSSSVTEFTLLDWDEEYNLRMGENCTRREAMLGLIRLLESAPNMVEGNHYISVYDATTYDKTIITPELLAAPSDLPEPTQAALTSEWRGIGITRYKDLCIYGEFQEADLQFLEENGLNFTRVFFFLSSLRYPDYPQDLSLINETELQDLDQLIAWGIEHGVHIQISACSTPSGHNGELNLDETEWEYYRAYWEALAHRYAGIPSRYLSFDLMNERQPGPENIEYGTGKMKEIVESIRKADPNRVMLISFQDNPDERWVEGMASIGLALAMHPYRPYYLCTGDEGISRRAEMSWPYPYFPQWLMNGEELTISGEIAGKELRLDFWVYEPFAVAFDNGEKIRINKEPDYIDENSNGGRFKTPLKITIPENAARLTISSDRDISFYEIGLRGKRVNSWLVPHDLWAGNNRGGAHLIWNDDKKWLSEKVIDGEFIYEDRVAPVERIAKKYGVGVMVNECGSYASGAYNNGIDVSVKVNYDKELLSTLQEKGMSWCVCEIYTMAAYIGREVGWSNTVTEKKFYLNEEGRRRSITYCTEVMDMYRQLIEQ